MVALKGGKRVLLEILILVNYSEKHPHQIKSQESTTYRSLKVIDAFQY
jgi:hypothetical protein